MDMTEYGTTGVTEYARMYLFLAIYKSFSDTVNYPTFIALVSFSKPAELKIYLERFNFKYILSYCM